MKISILRFLKDIYNIENISSQNLDQRLIIYKYIYIN